MKRFNRGDVIEFSGEEFLVINDFGSGGVVSEMPHGSIIHFKWNFQGTECKFLRTTEESQKLAEVVAKKVKL